MIWSSVCCLAAELSCGVALACWAFNKFLKLRMRSQEDDVGDLARRDQRQDDVRHAQEREGHPGKQGQQVPVVSKMRFSGSS